jgi:ATP-dependent 26S proteasome regulatory subunit
LICTFNTELENIDPALLRKGRLIARYEFPKMTPEKVAEISRQMGKEVEHPEAMSLADLTADQSLAFASPRKRRRLGFQIEDVDLPF